MSEPHVVATIRKNAAEEVRVALDTFHGINLIDVRVYADMNGTNGERHPTKKGVALRVDLLPKLIAALEDALRQARSLRLIGEPPDYTDSLFGRRQSAQ